MPDEMESWRELYLVSLLTRYLFIITVACIIFEFVAFVFHLLILVFAQIFKGSMILI